MRLERIVLYYLCIIMDSVMMSQDACEQGKNCRLPNCFCSTFEHPMNRTDIPQMVYFGFDDAVHTIAGRHYNYLFLGNHTNPNGCPISITLFVSDHFTNYTLLNEYHQHGFEIAVHSVTHTEIDTGAKVRKEADAQRNNIATKAGVPKEEIVGWRSPFLVTAGDPQIDALKQLGFTYDISLIYRRQRMKDDDAWPFTLDFGWPLQCDFQCPTQSHKRFWQVPINAMRDFKDQYACAFVDSCHNRPTNEEDAYKLIMDNFYSHYYGNRSPYGFHMHSAWFEVMYTRDAMKRAIADMLKYDDVYIINIKQVLEWMKNPTTLLDIQNFDPWGCWPRPNITMEIALLVGQMFLIVLSCIGFVVFCFRKRSISNKRNYIIMQNIDYSHK